MLNSVESETFPLLSLREVEGRPPTAPVDLRRAKSDVKSPLPPRITSHHANGGGGGHKLDPDRAAGGPGGTPGAQKGTAPVRYGELIILG